MPTHTRLFYRLLSALCLPVGALARAGGGGGHGSAAGYSSSGGYSGFHSYGSDGLEWPMVLALGAVVVAAVALNRLLRLRFREKTLAAERLLAQLAREDARWNLRHLTARVSEVFFRVQHAWTQNDQELARDCLSDRLYRKHKQQTDALLAQNQRNVLQDLKLDEIAVYRVADFADDARDTFAARLSGSMVDYMLYGLQSPLMAPGTLLPQSFAEVWTFVWAADRWVLDSIAPEAGYSQLAQGLAYSEAHRPAAGQAT